MRIRSPFREPVRVLMHLNGGYTRVSLIRTEGLGMADGGITWDIPTEAIPPHLRRLGSQLLAIVPRFTPEDHDLPDDIRRMVKQVEIQELSGADSFTVD
jgi:hypothetical protein